MTLKENILNNICQLLVEEEANDVPIIIIENITRGGYIA